MIPKSPWPIEARAARSEAGRNLLGASLTLALLAAVPAYGAGAKEQQFSSFTMNQNEIRFGAHKGYTWEAVAWIGTHTEKMYLKSEGESESGEGLEAGEAQILYSWQISDSFDAQAGIRHDFHPEPTRTYAVFGLHGLAPYHIEIDATIFLSERVDVSASLGAEHDLLITQQWALQSLIEIDFSAQDVDELDIAAGPTSFELGLRLRYEFAREFAPYIGIVYERDLFATERLTVERGEDPQSWSLVSGIRLFFLIQRGLC